MLSQVARRARLATSLPFIRPPIRAPYSDYVSRPTFGGSPFASPNPPPVDNDIGDIIGDMHAAGEAENPLPFYAAPSATKPLATDYAKTEKVAAHRLHCHSTSRNTINTFTDPDGNTLAWFSGGSCGFKKRNRSTYEAGYQCAVRMFEKIDLFAQQETAKGPDADMKIDLFCKGFGQGRDALFKALTTAQGDQVRPRIITITDRTPLKIGGTRARKRKRR